MGFLTGPVAQLLVEQCAVFLALLMGASAIHKIARWGRTLGAAREFVGVPAGAAAYTVVAACVIESLAAALLMAPSYRETGARLATVVLGLYLGLILRAIVLGRRDVDCGCSFGAPRRILGAFEVGRNTLLLILAALVALAGGSSAPASASEVLAAVAFLTLYGALDQVMGLEPMRKGTVL
jgi:methylamine utilization protein MauE